jgi:hypothetical protein
VTEQPDISKGPDAPFAYLEAANHQRLARVMSEYVPEVFRLNRIIEQRTGYQSEIGRNMMVDVLSHLGTLASRQDLAPDEQATQLSKIEEHLRRAIIEHPEEVIRERIVEVSQLWAEYQREAYAYRDEGVLRGVPRHKELDEMRKRIDVLMESARSVKPDETSWEESRNAAASMTEAAHLTGDLADKLEQCIGAALRITKEREQANLDTRRDHKSTKLWVIALGIAFLLAGGGYVLGKSDAPSPHPPQLRKATITSSTSTSTSTSP